MRDRRNWRFRASKFAPEPPRRGGEDGFGTVHYLAFQVLGLRAAQGTTGEVEAVNIYPLDELSELPIFREGDMAGRATTGVGLEAYTIYIDQVETKLLEAESEEHAVDIFLNGLTAGELLSMLRISASAD